jgi:futalosine hydrolase
MRILLVAATALEVAPVVAELKQSSARGRTTEYTHRGHEVDVLLTGVGMVAAGIWCARSLAERRYDVALNGGVCGSFDAALPPGAVVHIVSDRIVELGAEDGEVFLSIEDLNLLGHDEHAELVNPAPFETGFMKTLPAVRGITVNTVHGNERSIAAVTERFRPQVESMEGAAFMYACLSAGVPFAQIRAVSNIVERRNRGAWKMDEAVSRLGETVLAVLNEA